MVEEIKNDNVLLSIIIRADFKKEGIHFFTPNEFSQQLGYMNRPKGYVIDPHVHNVVSREVKLMKEVLFIKSGKVRVDFYDDNKNYLESRILNKNDVMKDEHYKELSKLLGIKLSNTNRKMDTYGFQLQDDIFAKIIDMARVRNIKLKQQFLESGHLEGGWMKLKYIYDGITQYKKERKLFDFTDMIIEFSASNVK